MKSGDEKAAYRIVLSMAFLMMLLAFFFTILYICPDAANWAAEKLP